MKFAYLLLVAVVLNLTPAAFAQSDIEKLMKLTRADLCMKFASHNALPTDIHSQVHSVLTGAEKTELENLVEKLKGSANGMNQLIATLTDIQNEEAREIVATGVMSLDDELDQKLGMKMVEVLGKDAPFFNLMCNHAQMMGAIEAVSYEPSFRESLEEKYNAYLAAHAALKYINSLDLSKMNEEGRSKLAAYDMIKAPEAAAVLAKWSGVPMTTARNTAKMPVRPVGPTVVMARPTPAVTPVQVSAPAVQDLSEVNKALSKQVLGSASGWEDKSFAIARALVQAPQGLVLAAQRISELHSDDNDRAKYFDKVRYGILQIMLQVLPTGAPSISDADLTKMFNHLADAAIKVRRNEHGAKFVDGVNALRSILDPSGRAQLADGAVRRIRDNAILESARSTAQKQTYTMEEIEEAAKKMAEDEQKMKKQR